MEREVASNPNQEDGGSCIQKSVPGHRKAVGVRQRLRPGIYHGKLGCRAQWKCCGGSGLELMAAVAQLLEQRKNCARQELAGADSAAADSKVLVIVRNQAVTGHLEIRD